MSTTLAGFRVLRLLAHGARCEVLLGYADGGHDGEPGTTRAVKRARPGSDPRAVDREIEALDRARGDHVVELIDIAGDEQTGEPCLVLERLPRGDLTTLLHRRQALEPGEAVTILAPLATTVSRLHRSGVAHGALTAAQWLFRADGAPALVGFGGAALFEAGLPEVALEGIPEVAADRAALLEVARLVLDRVPGEVGSAALAMAEQAAPESRGGVLVEALFAMAPSVPVGFEPRDVPSAVRATRVVPVGVAAPPSPDGDREPPDGESARAAVHRDLPAGWLSVLGTVLEGSLLARLRGIAVQRFRDLPSGRRRLLLGGGAAVATLFVALTALPAPQPGASAVLSSPSATGSPLADVQPQLTGDDPVAAVRALLAGRERCFRQLSVLCLDDIDQKGSAALDADRALVLGARSGGELPEPVDAAWLAPALTERLGDSALISLGPGMQPASLLLLKGEAGWRIRDLIAGEGAP